MTDKISATKNVSDVSPAADGKNNKEVRLVQNAIGFTYHPAFYRNFVEIMAREILDELTAFKGCEIDLNVYTAPWELEDMPAGQLTLRLDVAGVVANLGLVFGMPRDTTGKPVREYFDAVEFRKNPMNPHSNGTVLDNFDECWSLVCHLLQGLTPSQVTFSFGA
jgi:hypothetical protein